MKTGKNPLADWHSWGSVSKNLWFSGALILAGWHSWVCQRIFGAVVKCARCPLWLHIYPLSLSLRRTEKYMTPPKSGNLAQWVFSLDGCTVVEWYDEGMEK